MAIIPGSRRTVRRRFDTLGVTLASTALFCLAFGLTEGQRYDWNAWIWSLFGAAVVLFAGFLLHERGQQNGEPLVPFSLFKDRDFSLINFVGVTVSFGVVGMFLTLTIYLQSVLGFSAQKAGLVLLPVALGSFVMAGPAGALADRVGGKFILMGGLLAWAGGLVWVVGVADVGTGWLTIAFPLFLTGLGVGCTFAPMATEVMRNVPPRLAGAASGVTNALRQVGSVLAGAVIGAVLQARLASSLTEQARARAGQLPVAYRESFVAAFSKAESDVGAGQQGARRAGFRGGLPSGCGCLVVRCSGTGSSMRWGPPCMWPSPSCWPVRSLVSPYGDTVGRPAIRMPCPCPSRSWRKPRDDHRWLGALGYPARQGRCRATEFIGRPQVASWNTNPNA